MELKKIDYFLKIAQTGSLSKAAKALFLTQPTLSRFLENLEQELKVKLFTRSKTSALKLTPAGEDYLKTAKQIANLCKKMDHSLDRYRQSKHRIVFGIKGYYLTPFAAQCAKEVMEAFPEVSVDYFVADSQTQERLLLDGSLQIGLMSYEQKNSALAYVSVSKSPMQLVVSPQNPLADLTAGLTQQQKLHLCSLPNDPPMALMREGTVLRQVCDSYFKTLKYQPNIRTTYMRHGTIVRLLNEQPDLIAFCPENNISKNLTYIPLNPPFYYTEGIVYPLGSQLSKAEKYLICLLKNLPPLRDLDL